ncbi:MAG: rbsK [Rhodospirillales bacterium]|nr:rbsK [Rhodospirillales bacterium]
MSAEVVVVGSLGMDFVFRVPRLPRIGETLHGRTFSIVPGSKGGNQTVALARLGAQVAMIACVGNDDNGRVLRAGLEGDGVDCRAIEIIADETTGVAMVAVDDNGRNAIIIVPAAYGRLSPDIVAQHADLIDAAQFVVCQMEVPANTVEWTIRRAHKSGAKTILNPAPILEPLPADWFGAIDYLIPNEVEAEFLSGVTVDSLDSAQAAARRLREAGAANVLVTLGARGLFAATEDGVERHYPAKEVTAVDTTAAGDVFVGGFVASLARGRSVADAIGFGQAAAALSVTRHGAQTSIPRHEDIIQEGA